MKCFRHPGFDAVGFCKVCCKGLCRRCGVDSGHSFTCRGRCAAEAERYEREVRPKLAAMNEQHSRVGQEAEALLRNAAVRSGGKLFIPALFLLVGAPLLFEGVTRGERFAMFAYLGGVFVVMGLIYLYINLRVAKFDRSAGDERERAT
jgi:hypothetical protein